MNEIQILTRFKNKLVEFLDELINQFPAEGDLVLVRIFVKDQIPVQDIMNNFILTLLPLKEKVVKRDETFFLNHNVLFSEIDKGKVNHFKRLWRSPSLDENDKDVIWKWFDLFIRYAEKYQQVLASKS